MTSEERMDRLDEELKFVAALQRTNEEDIAKLIEQNSLLSMSMNTLAERSAQMIEAISRLARIADIHEQRIEDLEDQRPS
jgi:ABC-type transporter Mla subunit MlaD